MKNNILILSIAFFVTVLYAQERPASSTERGAKPLQLQTGNLIMPASSYAVVIGISDYQDKDIPDLQFADKDAEVFANYLRSNAGGKLDNDHLKVLLNADATMAQFAIALDWLMEVVKENDQVIIYFSGHGDVEKKTITQPGYLLCWDSPSRVYLAGGALALPMFQDIITTLSSQNKAKVIVITDACRSGKLAGSSVGGSQITGANLAKQYSNELKILSCQPNEYSIEGDQWGGGRGAFSYHLVNALYGLADNNNDNWVTVQEVGRYLEDHVTTEVAPMSQVPVIIGNRTEKISGVDDKILAGILAGKSNELVSLSSIESKGIEEQIMAGVDTSLKQLYQFFKKAIKDKKLLEPLNALSGSGQACADIYYEQLIKEPKLERLHSTMKRNYAAALQDDAQQAMNIWLKADVQQMECIGKKLKLEPIPRQLRRAAELLGEGHYMYRSLLARELLFEGIILSETNKNPNEVLGQKCLSMFRHSMQLEPQSPLTWYNMSLVYLHHLRRPDSASACVKEANILAPNWVLPYADLGYILYNLHFEDEMARVALSKAEAIDAAHPFVINRMAGLYARQGKHQTALEMFEKYRDAGGIMYPCWHNDYSIVLKELGKFADAESEMLKAIALDSTKNTSWINLGQIYLSTRRLTQAESVLKKGIALDSTFIPGWGTLGYVYQNSGQNIEAEKVYKKIISLDSTIHWVWSSLGTVYSKMQRMVETEHAYKKAVTLDSMSSGAWSNLGNVYMRMKRNVEAETAFKKAITLDSTFTVAWNGLGLLYTNMGRYAESELVLKKAISLDSTKTQALSNLGYLYNITRRFAEAEPVWKKIISLDSTIVWAWGNLGFAYLYANRFAESEAVYKKAVSIDPNRAISWVDLGAVYLYIHRYTEAEATLQKAISLDSTFAGAHKGLGTVYFRTGNLEKAQLGFMKSQKLNPNYFGSYLGMTYLFAREGKFVEAFVQLDLALQKCALHHLVTIPEDEDLASLRQLPQWNDLMKKYFPEKDK